MRATWYVLEDGTPVDPNEVTRDDDGALVHKGGRVAIGDHGNYLTTGVDLDEGASAKAKTEDMQPAPKPSPVKKPGYKTRGK